jgi:hypothetical protein
LVKISGSKTARFLSVVVVVVSVAMDPRQSGDTPITWMPMTDVSPFLMKKVSTTPVRVEGQPQNGELSCDLCLRLDVHP